jgi:hypothetical protein
MPYVYPDVDDLDGHALVGNAQCVVLVQTFTHAPRAADWKPGASVRGQRLLPKGTAIATFEDGVYKNRAHGNHAALYLGQDQGGIWVVDQWKDPLRKPKVTRRYLRFQGRRPNGAWKNAVDNGDAYSVIE